VRPTCPRTGETVDKPTFPMRARQIGQNLFMDARPENLTQLLKEAAQGSAGAADHLLRAVYDELRSLAKSWLAKTPPGQTLQPTALVHEAFLRLVDRDQQNWENRAHFFFAASRAMRDILVEDARAKGRIKRGGGKRPIDLDNLSVAVEAPPEDLIELDLALSRMETEYAWEHRIVMLRFFGGMTNQQTAEALGVPLRTLERDWRFARAWLHRALNDEQAGSGDAPN